MPRVPIPIPAKRMRSMGTGAAAGGVAPAAACASADPPANTGVPATAPARTTDLANPRRVTVLLSLVIVLHLARKRNVPHDKSVRTQNDITREMTGLRDAPLPASHFT